MGGAFDRVVGLARSPAEKVSILAAITVAIFVLGYCTTGLLEVIDGCWISVFMCRKGLLAAMDLVFAAIKGRKQEDLLQLSDRIKSELLSLAILAPLAVPSMPALAKPWIDIGDALELGPLPCFP